MQRKTSFVPGKALFISNSLGKKNTTIVSVNLSDSLGDLILPYPFSNTFCNSRCVCARTLYVRLSHHVMRLRRRHMSASARV